MNGFEQFLLLCILRQSWLILYTVYILCVSSLLSFQLIHFWAILMVWKEIYVSITINQL